MSVSLDKKWYDMRTESEVTFEQGLMDHMRAQRTLSESDVARVEEARDVARGTFVPVSGHHEFNESEH